MANTILATQSVARTHHQYRLSEADRQTILAATPRHIQQLEIERQRRAFMGINGGCAFGQKTKQIN